MSKYVCPKCGGVKLHYRNKSNQLVLRCQDCDTFIKMLPHIESHLYPEIKENIQIESPSLFGTYTDSNTCDECGYYLDPNPKNNFGKYVKKRCYIDGENVTPKQKICEHFTTEKRV